MSKLLTRLSVLLATLFVAGGLAFGATEATGSSMRTSCYNQPQGLIGTCPGDFEDSAECSAECFVIFENPGMCAQGCCQCTL